MRTLAIVFAALVGIGFSAMKAEAADYKQYQRQALTAQQRLEKAQLEAQLNATNANGQQRHLARRQMQNRHQQQWLELNNRHRMQWYYETERSRQQQQYRQWQQRQFQNNYRNWQYNQRYRYPNNNWNRNCYPNNRGGTQFWFGNGNFGIIIR